MTRSRACRYQDNHNGTVTDLETGLMWKRCSEGQFWDGNTCVGEATEMTWEHAMWERRTILDMFHHSQRHLRRWPIFAGYDDWRLPNTEELRTLLVGDAHEPCIDTMAFPNTPASWFWSKPLDDHDSGHARLVAFCGSYVDGSYRERRHTIRLVRNTTA